MQRTVKENRNYSFLLCESKANFKFSPCK